MYVMGPHLFLAVVFIQLHFSREQTNRRLLMS